MSTLLQKVLVMRVFVKDETYYVCNFPEEVTLDGELYQYRIISIGDIQKYGNFGEGSQRGSCAIELMFGSDHYQGDVIFNITKSWNNRKCEIKIADIAAGNSTWTACKWYYSGLIKNFDVSNNVISFDVDDEDYRFKTIVPIKTVKQLCEDRGLDTSTIPKGNENKRVPIQYGYLNDGSNGKFAKGILINQKIGFQQVVFDYRFLKKIENIGVWENGLKRFFIGRQKSIIDGNVEGEYEYNSSMNSAVFKVDSLCTLKTAISDTSAGEFTIEITNWIKLKWSDEDSVSEWQSYPELLSINVIAIDNELMLIVEKPTTSPYVYVERGYNGTTIATHEVGAAVYQCAKYAAKNLLGFYEKFMPVLVSNQYYNDTGAISTMNANVLEGSWSNLTDDDDSNYVKFYKRFNKPSVATFYQYRFTNFDIKFAFASIENDYSVYKWSWAVKLKTYFQTILGTPTNNLSNTLYQMLFVYSPDDNTNATENIESHPSVTIYPCIWHEGKDPSNRDVNYYKNTLSAIDRNGIASVGYVFQGQLREDLYQSLTGDPCQLVGLNYLNKKWKMCFVTVLEDANDPGAIYIVDIYATLYRIGLWVDFFIDMTKQNLAGNLQGRLVPTQIGTVTGSTNTFCINPVKCIVDIAIEEMGMSGTTDFVNSEWQAAWTYFNAFDSSTPAYFRMSYGIEDEKEGWELIQEMAAHACLAIERNDQGQLRCINLMKLQDKHLSVGYPSMTSYKIDIDDVIVSGNEKRFKIMQTGTDRLRNKVIIKYNRNNSTDEYQSEYQVSGDYILPESELTLTQAKNNYYDGKDTEALIIESPYIADEWMAKNLCRWHINDKAEIKFWIELTIPYYHYTLNSGKSAQYQNGDLIYINGKYRGVTFNSSFLFVINEIIYKDQGREIEIHAKSIKPIHSFTATTAGGNTTWQDTVDDTDIYQDTVDDTDIKQDKT